MDEAKRRREATGHQTKEAWRRALQQAHSEGQGVWEMTLIPCEEAGHLYARAVAGDAGAMRLIPLIGQTLRKISTHTTADRKTAPLCLLCDTRFWRNEPPQVLVVLNAHNDDPTLGIVSGICLKCRAAHPLGMNALKTAVLASYRTQLNMDDLRELSPIAPSGRA